MSPGHVALWLVLMAWAFQPSRPGECNMHNISRRNFVLSATTASAAFGLNGPLEFIGSAQAQAYANAKLIDKGFYKFRLAMSKLPRSTMESGTARSKITL